MKKINAPLCGRCADMLRSTFQTVEEVSDLGHKKCECVWCQKKDADSIFRLHAVKA